MNDSAINAAEREKDAPTQREYFEAGARNEGRVSGSVIEQTAAFVEEYSKPTLVEVTDPLSGATAILVQSRDGQSKALPRDVFDDYLDKPLRRTGTASLTDLSSFIAHVLRFADSDSAIFASDDRSRPSLTSVFDYHKVGAIADAGFGQHRATFAFPLSDEWKAWQAKNAIPMKMDEFAAFLEDRIIDVMPSTLVSLGDEASRFVETLGGMGRVADPAKLMELSKELHINEASTVRTAVNLSSGEGAIEFASEHMDAAGQKLVVPSMFVIAIPVFKNGDPYQVIARLRYRKQGGTIVFWYELWRTDRVFDHAFDESIEKVKEETELPVFLGSPEA